MEDRRRQIGNLEQLAHRHEKSKLSKCYQRLQEQHASIIEHRNKLHDKFVRWMLMVNVRRNTLLTLRKQLAECVGVFEEVYVRKCGEFAVAIDRLLSQCSHDFKRLEDELVELDCIPDLLDMVRDQGEKLKLLQEMDSNENNDLGKSL